MFNQIMVIGNLGKAPELKKTQSGRDCARFSLAVNEERLKDGKKERHTEWFSVTLWGASALTATKYLKSGSPVGVVGRLRTGQYVDGTGTTRVALNIDGEKLVFLPRNAPSDDTT